MHSLQLCYPLLSRSLKKIVTAQLKTESFCLHLRGVAADESFFYPFITAFPDREGESDMKGEADPHSRVRAEAENVEIKLSD